MRPRVRLFNVKFSPNLGDGLLSECLEQALVSAGADPGCRSIDLAARRTYGEALRGRSTLMAMLEAMPAPLRKSFIRLPLAYAARRWRPFYRRELAGADCVVVGGGNLIADKDLNFPTKLRIALTEIVRRKLPFMFYGVGVSSAWSRRGDRMMREVLATPLLKAVFVRDVASKRLWDVRFAAASGHIAQVVRDPGLLACERYPMARLKAGEPPLVGIGIMSPVALRYHAHNAPGAAALGSWYVAVARALLVAGYRLRIFTNGAPEDIRFVALIEDAIRGLGGGDRIAFTQPDTPEALCREIAGLDLLIAHRMHAVIAAYSYGVPMVALAWDDKLRSFMESVDRGWYHRAVTELSPSACVQLADAAIADGLAETDRTRVIEETRQGIDQLATLVKAFVQP